MILPLKEFDTYLNWNDAEIHYLQMVGNTIHMDVYFVTYRQSEKCKLSTKNVDMKTHLVFRNVSLFTDDYYSPLEKILTRFKSPYTCDSNEINEKDEFVIDDCLRIKCDEVEITELPH